MRVAYADPPYMGQAMKHYKNEPRAAEVDHEQLIHSLEQYDRWALSLSSPSLEEILHIARRVLGPNQVCVGAWVKPFASFKPGVNPAYAWEPVLLRNPRARRARTERTVRDWVSANITLKKGLSGVKPDAFSDWLFEALGMQADDEFIDLFPGSGAVTRAWEQYRTRLEQSQTAAA